MERTGAVTFKGNPMTLSGDQEVKEGDTAPDFTVVGRDMQPVRLSDFKGKTIIISSVPSLDTPVCQNQTRRFNQEASGLNCAILTISMDLPFAQKRFCESNSIGGLTPVSDFKEREFGRKYGLQIKELGLLARAVLIVDKNGKVVYRQIVPEVAQEPDYDAVLNKMKQLAAA